MPALNGAIQFKFGLQASYDAITTKDTNTAYFTTDKQRLFIGDVEYSRPIQRGTALPTAFLPPDSLFVKENGTRRELYYSKDGASWELISIMPATITGGVFGNNTAATVSAGGTFNVPKLTVDSNGFITAVEDVQLTLPAANSVTLTGDGNAVTGAEFDANGTVLTLKKEETFVTQAAFSAAMASVTSMSCQVVTSLPAQGEKGVIYLIAHAHSDDTNVTEAANGYDEYIWVSETSNYEKIGNTDIDLSGYVPTSRKINGQALTGDVTITDITGNAGTATKLANAHTIALSGAATGTATAFDGSGDITIPVTSIDGAKVNGTVANATNAASATKATQDASGNVITATYATKTELANAALVWGTF